MAAFTIVTASHNGDECLADYMFYVEPEHRNIRTLDALMKEIKGFSVENNLPIRIDFRHGYSLKGRERLLNRYGLQVQSVVGVCNGR